MKVAEIHSTYDINQLGSLRKVLPRLTKNDSKDQRLISKQKDFGCLNSELFLSFL